MRAATVPFEDGAVGNDARLVICAGSSPPPPPLLGDQEGEGDQLLGDGDQLLE